MIPRLFLYSSRKEGQSRKREKKKEATAELLPQIRGARATDRQSIPIYVYYTHPRSIFLPDDAESNISAGEKIFMYVRGGEKRRYARRNHLHVRSTIRASRENEGAELVLRVSGAAAEQ